MWKKIYKVLLVSFLSGSLLLLDFSFKGAQLNFNFNTARAETLKTDAVGEGTNIAATLTMVGIGVLASRLYRYKMTTDIMIAAAAGVAFVAGDIMEFMKIKEKLKDMETEIKRDVNGNLDNKQIESLEKLKKSYQTAKDTANTKKMLQMAAGAAFLAAAATAFMAAATEEAQKAQCLLGLQTATSAGFAADMAKCMADFGICSAPCSGPQAPACIAACKAQLAVCQGGAKACKAKITADMAAMTKYITGREKISPSAAGLAIDTTLSQTIKSSFPASAGTCTPYGASQLSAENSGNCPGHTAINDIWTSGGPVLFANNSGGQDPQEMINRLLFPHRLPPSPTSIVSNGPANYLKNYFDKAMDMMFPKAQAGLFEPMGIAGSLAISFILATNTALATKLDLNLLIPKRRAIIWGVLGGLAIAASVATGSEIGKIQSNIDRIDAILKSMYALDKGIRNDTNSVKNPSISTTSVKNENLANVNGGLGTDVDLSQNGTKMPCFTGDDANKCPSFSEGVKVTSNNFQGMPDTVKQSIGNISTLADGLNGTSKISSGTLDAAQALSAQQNALSREALKRQKALQEMLKKNGDKTDLNKLSKDMEKDFLGAVDAQLAKQKMSASQMYASFGARAAFGKAMGSGASALDGLAGKSKDANDKAAKGAGAQTPLITIPVDESANANQELADSELDKDKEAQELADKLAAEEAAKASAEDAKSAAMNIDDFELEGQINKDTEKSIFDQISNRYQKSGYPRLFRRIK